MKIESSDKKIEELLKGSTFYIPRFQRAYSWEADQISQFWSDVVDNLGEAYFIGSMVVYKRERSSFALVDGQQRLTTITLLLCAIRDQFNALELENLGKGVQSFIQQQTRENTTAYVLQTETSYPFLQEEILKGAPRDIESEVGREEAALKFAYEFFNVRLSSKIADITGNRERTASENLKLAEQWLSGVRDTVLDLNAIVVTLDNEDDAYLIFETLNTRGKDLALSDLIRNHFAKHLRPKSGVDQANIKWTAVLDTIAGAPSNLDPDTFIVHSWQSRYDFVTKAKIFPKLKEHVGAENAKEHLDRFVSDASIWRSIFDPDYGWSSGEKEAARSFRAIRTFKVVQPAPGLLSLIRAYRDNKIKYGLFIKALRMIEYFHFSFNAITSSRSSGGISGMYSLFGRDLFASADSSAASKVISGLRDKLKAREVDPSEFDVGFGQVIYTKQVSSQKSLVQYILRKLALHEKQPTIGETDDLTIEHLMPQSTDKDSSQSHVVGQIGNLILVDGKTNNLLANKTFAEKKRILAANGYKLPAILQNSADIDETLIRQNTARLSELARSSIWKIK